MRRMTHAPTNSEAALAVAASVEREAARPHTRHATPHPVRQPMPPPAPQAEACPRAPAAPLFAATLAFCGGILLQHSCYKPPSIYLLCTLGFALCSVAA